MPTNPLTEVLPARLRKGLYAVLFVAGLGFAAWQAADGDWTAFVSGLVTALAGALAASNTYVAPKLGRGEDGAVDTVVLLLFATLLGVVLLLFGVRLG